MFGGESWDGLKRCWLTGWRGRGLSRIGRGRFTNRPYVRVVLVGDEDQDATSVLTRSPYVWLVVVPTRTAIPLLRSRTAPMFEWLREWSGYVVVDVAFGCVIGDGDVLECAAWELWDSQAVDPWFGEDVWSSPVLD